MAELDELRAEKEHIRTEFEQAERAHKRQIADQLSESKLFLSEKDTFKSKSDSLEDEIKISQRKVDELQQENTNLKRELDKTVNRLEENGHKFKYFCF